MTKSPAKKLGGQAMTQGNPKSSILNIWDLSIENSLVIARPQMPCGGGLEHWDFYNKEFE